LKQEERRRFLKDPKSNFWKERGNFPQDFKAKFLKSPKIQGRERFQIDILNQSFGEGKISGIPSIANGIIENQKEFIFPIRISCEYLLS